jgi:hypothetical protein
VLLVNYQMPGQASWLLLLLLLLLMMMMMIQATAAMQTSLWAMEGQNNGSQLLWAAIERGWWRWLLAAGRVWLLPALPALDGAPLTSHPAPSYHQPLACSEHSVSGTQHALVLGWCSCRLENISDNQNM